MMKAWMEAATPGEHHKAREPMAGRFTCELKMRMDPQQEWMSSQGDYEGEMSWTGATWSRG